MVRQWLSESLYSRDLTHQECRGLHHAQAMLWRPTAIRFAPLAFTFCLCSLCYLLVLQPALFLFFYALLNSKAEKLNLENNIHYYSFFFFA